MISEWRDLSYEERLKECCLTTPYFKILNGYEDIDRNMFFKKAVEPDATKQH